MTGGSVDAIELSGNSSDRAAFSSLFNEACEHLARQIVLDGEGATKLVRIHVRGAPDMAAATRVARTVAESPLVKTAFHGSDPTGDESFVAWGIPGLFLIRK